MAGIYCVPNCDFDYVFSLFGSTRHKIGINSLESKIVLVTEKTFLSKNLLDINRTLNKKLFLIFSTLSCLKEFNLEDTLDNNSMTKDYLIALLNRKSNLDQLHYKQKSLAKSYLKKSKVSVIKDIMTVLYKVQNKSLRESYRILIFSYLNREINDTEKLKNSLISLSKKKSSTLKDLVDIIDSDIFSTTHSSVLDVKKGLSNKTKISSFDINYILSFKK